MPPRTEPRRQPRQSRGHRRVDALLNAAAEEIGAVGYEAATMCSIAERAGASIGSLYQFFPNKLAVVQALRQRYCEEFEQLWAPLADEAPHESLGELVNQMVDSTVAFVERHPAFLALLDAPGSTHAPAGVKERFQQLVATFFLARRPRMSPEKALRLATMTLQMVKSMNFLYRELSPPERRPYVQEFKILLERYLECRIDHQNSAAGHREVLKRL
jgi:AcrR family transcriptional regulator